MFGRKKKIKLLFIELIMTFSHGKVDYKCLSKINKLHRKHEVMELHFKKNFNPLISPTQQICEYCRFSRNLFFFYFRRGHDISKMSLITC